MRYLLFLAIIFSINFQLISEETSHNMQAEFISKINKLGKVDDIELLRTKGYSIQQLKYGVIKVPIEVTVEFPNKFTLNLQDKEFIVENDKGWLKYEQGFYENLPEDFIKKTIANLYRNLIYLARYKEQVTVESYQKILEDDNDLHIFHISFRNNSYTLVFDSKTEFPSYIKYTDTEGNQIKKIYDKFKETKGIIFPVHTLSYDDSENLISENLIDSIFVKKIAID